MSLCPVCHNYLDIGQARFQAHVEAHFDDATPSPAGPSSTFVASGTRSTPVASTSRDRGGHAGGSPATVMSGQSIPPPYAGRMENTLCPICDIPLTMGEETARQAHVNACLDRLGGNDITSQAGSAGPMFPPPPKQDFSPDFIFSPDNIASTGQRADDTTVDTGWDGPARPGSWSGWVGKRPDRGDRWWDPIDGSVQSKDIPSTFAPGMLPVLISIVGASVARGLTKSAALSLETVNIHGSWGFDMGWGCGYRNACMAISSLLLSQPLSRRLFSADQNGSPPGIRRVQGWLEEAWEAGYDPAGKKHYRGKILGTRKWVGTADLWAMFTYKGIDCTLYDFPRAKHGATSHVLLRWVKGYFQLPLRDTTPLRPNATEMVLRATQGKSQAVRLTDRLPLILQHSGHSRTIVGYEEDARGEISLLMFDPGKNLPATVRVAGIASLKRTKADTDTAEPQTNALSRPTSLNSRRSSNGEGLQSYPFARPYTNGASEIVGHETPQPSRSYTVRRSASRRALNHDHDHDHDADISNRVAVRARGGAVGGADGTIEIDSDDEVMDERGWVKKKVQRVLTPWKKSGELNENWKLPEALNYFRVTFEDLKSNHEYQILAFSGSVVTEEQRRSRKEVRSTRVQ